MALEFVGERAEALSIDERLAVANMAVEAGSETGLLPGRRDRCRVSRRPHRTGPGPPSAPTPTPSSRRRSASTWTRCSPLVALPHSPGNVVPLDQAVGRKIDQVYIGNCSNGTMTDLRQAAEMLRGRKVIPRTRAIIVPASQRVYREALAEGLLDLFVEAGAMVSTPTCGACFGGSGGVLAPGENAITTTNRNFRGGWARARPACTWRTPGLRPRRRSRARSSTRPSWRGGMKLERPGDRDPPGRRRHRRALSRRVPQRHGRRADDPHTCSRVSTRRCATSSAAIRRSSSASNFGAGSSREHVPQAMAPPGSASSSARASRASSTATASTSACPR